jgi:hypothetical protein
MLEIPAPRWEIGTFGAASALYEGLGAKSLLVAGALPNADPYGSSDPRRRASRRSFFQRAHELWLGARRQGISVQGIAPERDYGGDAVISFGFEILKRDQVPAWAMPLRETLDDAGLSVGMFDGTRQHAAYSGTSDLAMSYARRFADGQFAIVYLSGSLRAAFAEGDVDGITEARLSRIGMEVPTKDVAARAMEIAACPAPYPGQKPTSGTNPSCPAFPQTVSRCDIDKRLGAFRLYLEQKNPYDLRAAVKEERNCVVEVDRDASTRRIWVLVARPGEVAMIPLGNAAALRPSRTLSSFSRIRRAVNVGLTGVRVTHQP